MADSKEFYSDAIALMKTIARGNQSSKAVIGASKPKGKLVKKISKGIGKGKPNKVSNPGQGISPVQGGAARPVGGKGRP